MMPAIEWIGYLASVLIIISLMMISILRYRLINLAGAAAFAVYGFMIGSIPVGMLNSFVVVFNLYHLYQFLLQTEDYKLLKSNAKGEYVEAFLSFYENDIKRYFPDFRFNVDYDRQVWLVLRNMVVAGMLVGHEENRNFIIEMDYAIPQYRDFRLGKFLYRKKASFFGEEKGYKQFITRTEHEAHRKYLLKMGFQAVEDNGETLFVKPL